MGDECGTGLKLLPVNSFEVAVAAVVVGRGGTSRLAGLATPATWRADEARPDYSANSLRNHN